MPCLGFRLVLLPAEFGVILFSSDKLALTLQMFGLCTFCLGLPLLGVLGRGAFSKGLIALELVAKFGPRLPCRQPAGPLPGSGRGEWC